MKAIFPENSFTTNLEKQPTGHLCWTPEIKDARDNPYQFSISVFDREDPSIRTTFNYSITVPLIKVDIATMDVTCYGNSDGIAIASYPAEAEIIFISGWAMRTIHLQLVDWVPAKSQYWSWMISAAKQLQAKEF